jgi:hypothetical protein
MGSLYRSGSLPLPDSISWATTVKWMGRDFSNLAYFTIPSRITKTQLAFQVPQLEIKLALGDGHRPGLSFSCDLARIEGVSSLADLVMDRPEIGRDGRHRRLTLPKSVKVWIVAAAFCLSLQHLLGEQGFTPKSDQTHLVQKVVLERPETHRTYLRLTEPNQDISYGTHNTDVQGDDNPEHDTERYLLRLMPKLSLGEKRTWPSTQECQQMQGAFGDSTASGGGSPLIRSVCKEGSKAHDEDHEQVNGDGDVHG